jgi:AraC-like DNA-binding protein
MTHAPPLLYRDWLNLKTNLLWCYDSPIGDRNRRDTGVQSVAYSNNAAWLVRRGSAEVRHGNQVLRAGPGEWLIAKPAQRTQRFAPDTHLLSLSFDARWPDGSKWLDEGLSVVLSAQACPELEKLALPMVELMGELARDSWDVRDEHVPFTAFLKLQSLLNDWLSCLGSTLVSHGVRPVTHGGIDERVARAVRLLEGHSLGEALDLRQLAAQAGLSPVHLARLFRQDLALTPYAYFEKLRLEFACRRLRVPDARIKEVAIDLGFASLSHFSKWFRKHQAQSPRQYRQASDT